ncbi:MAG: alpha/beta hydrolase [Clostridia bacterium]|nr:alpha/beta hydrolase [Clostridia bacterium]
MFKKILSVALCVSLLAAFAPCVFASDSCDCGTEPFIFVEGINTIDLVLDRGTENEQLAFPPSTESIVNAVLKVVPTLLVSDFYSADELADKLTAAVAPLFETIALDPDGNSLYNVTTEFKYPTTDHHKQGGRYTFCYDWRLDMHTLASQLHDYIEYVKELTGHDSVHLLGFSMGTCVMDQYLVDYGYDGLESVIYYAGAYNGVSCCGEPMSNKIATDPKALVSYIDALLGEDDSMATLKTALNVLYKMGVFGVATNLVTDLYNKIGTKLARDTILRTFATMPGMLALMSLDDYNDYKEFVYTDEETAELWSRVIELSDDYHYNVQAKVPQIFDDIQTKVGRLAVIAKYGFYATPAMTDYDVMSDTTIDTAYESAGATCSKVFETLGDDYVQAVDDGHNHISPDNQIDASTCLLPDKTWFIKNLTHSRTGDTTYKLIRFIQENDTPVDIFTSADYPQFLYYDTVAEEISPLTVENASNTLVSDPGEPFSFKKLFDRIFAFIKMIFDFVTGINAAT